LTLSTLLRWPQPAYFVFIVPFLCIFVMQAFYTDRRRNLILAAILFFTIPQYVHRYRLWSSHRPSLSQHDQNQLSTAITRNATLLGKPPGQVNILGDYHLWFAHPHRFVNLNRKILSRRLIENSDLILCIAPPDGGSAKPTQEVLCTELNRSDYKQAEELTLNSYHIRLLIPIHTISAKVSPSP